jgi:hypothetical protein
MKTKPLPIKRHKDETLIWSYGKFVTEYCAIDCQQLWRCKIKEHAETTAIEGASGRDASRVIEPYKIVQNAFAHFRLETTAVPTNLFTEDGDAIYSRDQCQYYSLPIRFHRILKAECGEDIALTGNVYFSRCKMMIGLQKHGASEPIAVFSGIIPIDFKAAAFLIR